MRNQLSEIVMWELLVAVIARDRLLKFIFSIDHSNCYSYNHVTM